MKRLLVAISILLLVSSFAFAGFERTLHYKFDVNSPAAMNLEGGIAFDYINYNSDVDGWVLDGYAKYGITDKWELGLDLPYISISPDVGEDVDGIGDLNVWTKYRFLDESKTCMGLAAGVNVKLNTGDEDVVGTNDDTDWTPFIMASFKPAEQFALGAKLGYTFMGEDNTDDEFLYGVWGGYYVKPNFGIVAELYGNTQEGDDPLMLDAGVTYGVSENVGVTFGGGAGLNDAAADWHIFAAIKGAIALGK
ncbi:MAG: transporter [bacterium]